MKTLHSVSVCRQGDYFYFDFRASAFLHHMVRNMVGSLVYVGKGKYPPEWIGELLAARNRTRAAPTFSPAGLYLAGVRLRAALAAAGGWPYHRAFSRSGALGLHRTRIKICGITRTEDVLAAARLGADAIGLVFYPPSPRFVEADQARAIALACRHSLPLSAFSSMPSRLRSEAFWIECRCKSLQLHGDETPCRL